MAEFCLDCWNGYHKGHLTPEDAVCEAGLCEGCRSYTLVVVALRRVRLGWRHMEYLVWRQCEKRRPAGDKGGQG